MKKRKNTLKIIASTSVTLFSLFTLFVSSFAWFLAKRNADADGSGFITSTEPSKIEKVEIFKEVSKTNYIYNTTADATYENDAWDTESPLNFGVYSTIDQIHTSLIVITLREAEAFEINILNPTEYASSLVCINNNTPTLKLEASGNPLSSVIRISNVEYLESHDYSNNLPTEKYSFVNQENNVFPESQYKNSIDFSSEDETTKIALIVEYYPEAMQYIYSINLGNKALNNATLSFKCDWSINLK